MDQLPLLSPIVKMEVHGLPEIGKIKIGEKGQKYKNSKGYMSSLPKKNDFFTVTTLERDESDNLKKNTLIHKELEKDFGRQPRSIPIKLMYNDIALNYQSRFACYDGKSPICVGDGENAITYENNNGKVVETGTRKCPCERADRESGTPGRCSVKCRLSVILDCEMSSTGGVWVFRSGGFYSAMGLRQSLTFIHEATFGRMAGVPLRLTVRPQTAQVAIKGKLSNTTIYVVGVIYPGSTNALQEKAFEIANKNAMFAAKMESIEENARNALAYEQSLLIEAPDISEEFHPEENQESIENPEETKSEPEPIPEQKEAEEKVAVVIDNATKEAPKKPRKTVHVASAKDNIVVTKQVEEDFIPEETKSESAQSDLSFDFGTDTKKEKSSKESEQTDIDFSF